MQDCYFANELSIMHTDWLLIFHSYRDVIVCICFLIRWYQWVFHTIYHEISIAWIWQEESSSMSDICFSYRKRFSIEYVKVCFLNIDHLITSIDDTRWLVFLEQWLRFECYPTFAYVMSVSNEIDCYIELLTMSLLLSS
jgi:hypothetical protein